EVLVDRIGRAAIPRIAELLLRGDDVDELAELAVQITPAASDVLDQRLRLVLRENEDLADPRVHAVRQREVDDPVLAAERRRGLRAVVRHVHQTLTAAARHDDRHRAARELTHDAMHDGALHLAEAPSIVSSILGAATGVDADETESESVALIPLCGRARSRRRLRARRARRRSPRDRAAA